MWERLQQVPTAIPPTAGGKYCLPPEHMSAGRLNFADHAALAIVHGRGDVVLALRRALSSYLLLVLPAVQIYAIHLLSYWRLQIPYSRGLTVLNAILETSRMSPST